MTRRSANSGKHAIIVLVKIVSHVQDAEWVGSFYILGWPSLASAPVISIIKAKIGPSCR